MDSVTSSTKGAPFRHYLKENGVSAFFVSVLEKLLALHPQNPLELIRDELNSTLTQRNQAETMQRQIEKLQGELSDLKLKTLSDLSEDQSPIDSKMDVIWVDKNNYEIQVVDLMKKPAPEALPVGNNGDEGQTIDLSIEPVNVTESSIGQNEESMASNDEITVYDTDTTVVELIVETVNIEEESDGSATPSETDPLEKQAGIVDPADRFENISEEMEHDEKDDSLSNNDNDLLPSITEEEEDEFHDTTSDPLNTSLASNEDSTIPPPKTFSDDSRQMSQIGEMSSSAENSFVVKEDVLNLMEEDLELKKEMSLIDKVYSTECEKVDLKFITELKAKQQLTRNQTEFELNNNASKMKCSAKLEIETIKAAEVKPKPAVQIDENDLSVIPESIPTDTTVAVSIEVVGKIVADEPQLECNTPCKMKTTVSSMIDESTDTQNDLNSCIKNESLDDSNQLNVSKDSGVSFPPQPFKRTIMQSSTFTEWNISKTSTPLKETSRDNSSNGCGTLHDPEMEHLMNKSQTNEALHEDLVAQID